MLYEPGPWDPEVSSSKKPILHVGYIEHVLCRAPLTPCFLDGNSTNTIPHSKRSESGNFPHGKCDSQPGAGNGSLVYEVNMPLWRFGRGKSRRMSVEDAVKERSVRIEEGRRQGRTGCCNKKGPKELSNKYIPQNNVFFHYVNLNSTTTQN